MRFARKLGIAASCLLLGGCASTATLGGHADSCGRDVSPRDFCANFDAPSLRGNRASAAARGRCQAFYAQAIESSALLCSYFSDLDRLTLDHEELGSPELSARGKDLQRKYQELALEHEVRLDAAYRDQSLPSLETLAGEGRRELGEALACSSRPGHAGAFLLLGLAAQSVADEKETYVRLRSDLFYLAKATKLNVVRGNLALRESIGIKTGSDESRRGRETLVAKQLSEPALLALGYHEAPAGEAVDRLYAAAQKAPLPHEAGRGLASVPCAVAP